MTVLPGAVYPTYSDKGKAVRNGHLQTIWRESDEIRLTGPNGTFYMGYKPAQVYVTTILPGMSKGPHLHHKRAGLFTCVKGSVVVITRLPDGSYEEVFTGDEQSRAVYVPKGTPALIVNRGQEEAFIVNMPDGMYDPSDEHEADFTDYLETHCKS